MIGSNPLRDNQVIKSGGRWKMPVMIGTPTLGRVRIEWSNAITNMVLPLNWSASNMQQPMYTSTPLGFHVAEAQNLIVKETLDRDYEWLFLLEDDVIPPPDVLLIMRRWMDKEIHPVVSGLYNVKSNPPEPMIFKGRGNGAFKDWKPGDAVECDGVATGCLLISTKLLRACWDAAPEDTLKRQAQDGSIHEIKIRQVFRTTRDAGIDPETGGYYKRMGTSDLEWCDHILDNGLLKEAGFHEASEKHYPFIVDTSIGCGHIDLMTGVIY